ncbi:DUF4263 domain-containing protein [Geomonas sp. Red69]|uniref:Shedu immune nuclease family protein n=1 Tax=Geomonas diazotrophica TaxID=2843197 RepID=UPI001C129666|nr:Shedu immune nuclease family protein [Geomonas diazotrophica]MBU5636550.1 DUF4263 domain-containing protein [Geomonas diazotrophica]
MACEVCRDVQERLDVPHVIRKCTACGREMHIVEPGEHGKGIKISAGDTFIIPEGYIKLSLNPLKSSANFSTAGLEWFASQIFIDGLPDKEETFLVDITALEAQIDTIVNSSELIQPLDINNPDHIEKILEILLGQKHRPEFWAMLSGHFLAVARDARESNDAEKASWATACAERCRAMLIYKQHLEEVVWMGHSAKRVINVLQIWDSNQKQGDEEFWQLTLSEHSYVLSQVFAVPVVFVGEKAYVGGMRVDRSEAKFVDYLFSAESSRESLLVEIKTPLSRLLGSRYRAGVFAPSAELTGAVVQVLTYRTELIRNLQSVTDGSAVTLQAFAPKCVLIIGNAHAELNTPEKRRSFELFRASCEVEIVTYDELFRKVEILAQLFSLQRTSATAQTTKAT